MSVELAALADRLHAPETHLLVVTGAGISLASGIPTFRGTDPGAVWKNETTEIGTAGYLARDPVGWWRWVLKLHDTVLGAEPNAAHVALAELERWHRVRTGSGSFLLVTQNIDLLHERAGSERMVKVHGTADRVRCSRYGCPHGAPAGSLPASDFDLARMRDEPSEVHLPRCPTCGAVIRSHVLLFDELYDEHVDYRFPDVLAAVERMDLALFVGTSFSVGVTDLILRSAQSRRVPLFSIDPAAHRLPAGLGVTHIAEPAESALPRLCRLLEVTGVRGDGTAPS